MSDEKFDRLEDAMTELSGHVLTLAKQVYKVEVPDDDMYEEDEEKAFPEDMEEDAGVKTDEVVEKKHTRRYKGAKPTAKVSKKVAAKDGDDEDSEEEKQKYLESQKKGFADSAKDASDEEDAPFDERQSNIEGNEPQPSGDMGGDRGDETFGKMLTVMGEVRDLLKDAKGETKIDKSVSPEIPGAGSRAEASRKEEGGQTPNKIELEKQLKDRSWKEINRFRIEVGELSGGII